MSKFKELYNADIARYGGKPEVYIRIFHYLYRKASVVSFAPILDEVFTYTNVVGFQTSNVLFCSVCKA